MEALARWADPERGLISPGVFIPVLSRYHLLHKLDLYMVEQICREFRVRKDAGLPGIPVSVNFSAQDFDYIDVTEILEKTLEKYEVPRDSIIVEITEQDLAQASDLFIEQLFRIHDNGHRLWLDDFGSGYSSLNTFSRYHIDRIKFDMDLIKHLDDNNGANRIIMKSITEMCRQMGIHTLAEGIETEEQYRFLSEIGCGMVQGFYFFRPQPVDQLIASH
jgi:EAL domain-containing protein (putative c-di-GMP-specific phosphodiesterase class I)